MSKDLELALALLFRRTGAPATSDALVQAASLGLGWCKPSQAWNIVARGVAAGLVRAMPDGRFAPTANPQGTTVPLGFAPPADLFEAVSDLPSSTAEATPPDPSDLFETVLERLAEKGMARQAAVAQINKTHAALGAQVSVEVAGILTLLERGGEAADLVEKAARSLRAQ